MFSTEELNKLTELKENTIIDPDLIEVLIQIGTAQQGYTPDDNAKISSVELTENPFVAGTPLFKDNVLPVDLTHGEKVFMEILRLCSVDSSPLKWAALNIVELIKSKTILVEDVLVKVASREHNELREYADTAKDATGFLFFCAYNALLPSTMFHIEKITELNEIPKKWTHGHCPVCGGSPYISHLEGEGGARHLTCVRCQTTYESTRMACAFCQSPGNDGMESFSIEELPAYKVTICDSCNGYIKTADFREYTRNRIPRTDDLESIQLDMLAQEQKFVRMTRSGWGF
ncbi:MAG: formate dehydrogenase accessory protein FdhE [Desulfovibrio sp.]